MGIHSKPISTAPNKVYRPVERFVGRDREALQREFRRISETLLDLERRMNDLATFYTQ